MMDFIVVTRILYFFRISISQDRKWPFLRIIKNHVKRFFYYYYFFFFRKNRDNKALVL
jgi:hypothetical protein